MKFSKLSQLALVSTLGLLAASLVSGCLIVTVDYVFVASSSGTAQGSSGQIQTFAVDSESGAVRAVDSVVSSGGSGPVALAVTGDYANLYVANQVSSTVVHFLINGDGSLTQKETVSVPFEPTALAVNTLGTNAAGTYLYVVGGATTAQLAEYPLSSGTIGTLAYSTPLTISQTYANDDTTASGITVLPNNSGLFVTVDDQSAYNPTGTPTSSAKPGWLFGFTIGGSGVLNPTSGSPYLAGVKPNSLAADPTSRFLYVTDYVSNQLIGYNLESDDTASAMSSGPSKTGSEPTAVTVDPRGLYIYVANALSSNISDYTIALGTGVPSAIATTAGTASLATDTEPVAILVEPSEGRYIYTANHLGNSVSGFRLNPNTGAVSPTQATPYPLTSGVNPTAIAAVPHGNHAVQSVTP